ncbi:MAG: serine/threonine protein kinase [Deltaproteobacteria bacterium]|nr:MAG: serine/threonine protein kinase [Deltaproteobacteria bacterium]
MLTADPSLSCSNCQQTLTSAQSSYEYCPFCQLPFQPLLGRYRIDSKLAEGGFGYLYAGHDEAENQDCVVKVIRTELLDTDELSIRFLREIRLTQQLSEASDHIVRLLGYGEESSLGHFYVMERLYGETLRERVQRKPLTFREIFHILEQLCVGMAAAHKQHIVHRDLKPSNLFLSTETVPLPFLKILDFGIAKSLEGTIHHNLTQGILGTSKYMSPEQFDLQPITPASDIYVMGLIAYELLTGTSVFVVEGDSMAALMNLVYMHHYEIPEAPSLRRPELSLPSELDDVLLKALAKLPEDRFASATAMWEALAPFSSMVGLVTPAVEGPRPASSSSPQLFTQTGEPLQPSPLPTTPPPSTGPSQDDVPFLPTLGAIRTPKPVAPLLLSVESVSTTTPASRPSVPLGFVMSLCLFLVAMGTYAARPMFLALFRSHTTLPKEQQPTPSRIHPKGAVETPNAAVRRSVPMVPNVVRPSTPRSVQVLKRPAPRRKRRVVLARRVRKRTKTRRIRTIRRANQARRRAPQRRNVSHASLCGRSTSQWRWVQGSFAKAKLRQVRVAFLRCPSCRSKRRGSVLCLRLPRKPSLVTLRVHADGFHACRHTVRRSVQTLRWKLRVYRMDDLVNETYPCHKEGTP